MKIFTGRARELKTLSDELEAVRRGGDEPGRCVLLRGRRRVGKSRLVERFIEQRAIPAIFYTATGVTVESELSLFTEQVRQSDLPARTVFDGVTVHNWDTALRLLADAAPADKPSVIVIDELPYLLIGEPGFEAILQRAWDRQLSKKPILLILIGSDISMMEALNTYGRPFHQRGVPMVLQPLGPAEVGEIVDLPPAETFDAYLLTGGLPLLCAEWEPGTPVRDHLAAALAHPTSALTVTGQLSMLSEFPTDGKIQSVLSAIGSGERTRAAIGRAAGSLPHSTVDRSLRTLDEKRITVAERPLSTRPSTETRYRIADPYLRFWLTFVGPHLDELDRGRCDRVLRRIDSGWTSWRGRAIEPVIRESLLRLLPDESGLDAPAVGAYWTRTNDVEVDLIGADRQPIANQITFVGSIKWLDNRPFDHHDLTELIVHRNRVPGATDHTPLVAAARAGSTAGGLVHAVGPAELLAAWHGV